MSKTANLIIWLIIAIVATGEAAAVAFIHANGNSDTREIARAASE